MWKTIKDLEETKRILLEEIRRLKKENESLKEFYGSGKAKPGS